MSLPPLYLLGPSHSDEHKRFSYEHNDTENTSISRAGASSGRVVCLLCLQEALRSPSTRYHAASTISMLLEDSEILQDVVKVDLVTQSLLTSLFDHVVSPAHPEAEVSLSVQTIRSILLGCLSASNSGYRFQLSSLASCLQMGLNSSHIASPAHSRVISLTKYLNESIPSFAFGLLNPTCSIFSRLVQVDLPTASAEMRAEIFSILQTSLESVTSCDGFSLDQTSLNGLQTIAMNHGLQFMMSPFVASRPDLRVLILRLVGSLCSVSDLATENVIFDRNFLLTLRSSLIDADALVRKAALEFFTKLAESAEVAASVLLREALIDFAAESLRLANTGANELERDVVSLIAYLLLHSKDDKVTPMKKSTVGFLVPYLAKRCNENGPFEALEGPPIQHLELLSQISSSPGTCRLLSFDDWHHIISSVGRYATLVEPHYTVQSIQSLTDFIQTADMTLPPTLLNLCETLIRALAHHEAFSTAVATLCLHISPMVDTKNPRLYLLDWMDQFCNKVLSYSLGNWWLWCGAIAERLRVFIDSASLSDEALDCVKQCLHLLGHSSTISKVSSQLLSASWSPHSEDAPAVAGFVAATVYAAQRCYTKSSFTKTFNEWREAAVELGVGLSTGSLREDALEFAIELAFLAVELADPQARDCIVRPLASIFLELFSEASTIQELGSAGLSESSLVHLCSLILLIFSSQKELSGTFKLRFWHAIKQWRICPWPSANCGGHEMCGNASQLLFNLADRMLQEESLKSLNRANFMSLLRVIPQHDSPSLVTEWLSNLLLLPSVIELIIEAMPHGVPTDSRERDSWMQLCRAVERLLTHKAAIGSVGTIPQALIAYRFPSTLCGWIEHIYRKSSQIQPALASAQVAQDAEIVAPFLAQLLLTFFTAAYEVLDDVIYQLDCSAQLESIASALRQIVGLLCSTKSASAKSNWLLSAKMVALIIRLSGINTSGNDRSRFVRFVLMAAADVIQRFIPQAGPVHEGLTLQLLICLSRHNSAICLQSLHHWIQARVGLAENPRRVWECLIEMTETCSIPVNTAIYLNLLSALCLQQRLEMEESVWRDLFVLAFRFSSLYDSPGTDLESSKLVRMSAEGLVRAALPRLPSERARTILCGLQPVIESLASATGVYAESTPLVCFKHVLKACTACSEFEKLNSLISAAERNFVSWLARTVGLVSHWVSEEAQLSKNPLHVALHHSEALRIISLLKVIKFIGSVTMQVDTANRIFMSHKARIWSLCLHIESKIMPLCQTPNLPTSSRRRDIFFDSDSMILADTLMPFYPEPGEPKSVQSRILRVSRVIHSMLSGSPPQAYEKSLDQEPADTDEEQFTFQMAGDIMELDLSDPYSACPGSPDLFSEPHRYDDLASEHGGLLPVPTAAPGSDGSSAFSDVFSVGSVGHIFPSTDEQVVDSNTQPQNHDEEPPEPDPNQFALEYTESNSTHIGAFQIHLLDEDNREERVPECRDSLVSTAKQPPSRFEIACSPPPRPLQRDITESLKATQSSLLSLFSAIKRQTDRSDGAPLSNIIQGCAREFEVSESEIGPVVSMALDLLVSSASLLRLELRPGDQSRWQWTDCASLELQSSIANDINLESMEASFWWSLVSPNWREGGEADELTQFREQEFVRMLQPDQQYIYTLPSGNFISPALDTFENGIRRTARHADSQVLTWIVRDAVVRLKFGIGTFQDILDRVYQSVLVEPDQYTNDRKSFESKVLKILNAFRQEQWVRYLEEVGLWLYSRYKETIRENLRLIRLDNNISEETTLSVTNTFDAPGNDELSLVESCHSSFFDDEWIETKPT